MNPKSVIIVDDTLDIARLLRTVLVSLDPTLSISVVPSAEEAILEAARSPVDLLVTDVRLPGITGFELVKKIRSRYPNVKTIIVTGLTESRINLEAQEMGIETVLFKPLDMDAFRSAICNYLDIQSIGLGNAPIDPRLILDPPARPTQKILDLQSLLNQTLVDLGAEAVAVIDANGTTLVETGAHFDWTAWLSAVPALQKVIGVPKEVQPENVFLVRAGALDFALSGLGEAGILVALKPGRTAARLLAVAGELLSLQVDLCAALAPDSKRIDENEARLADLLQRQVGSLKKEEVEHYWESATTLTGISEEDKT
jgi:CheY-like chemotaxis protein